MNNFKKLILGILTVSLLMGSFVIGFATTSYDNPAEAVASLTGKTFEEVLSQRQKGISYGQMAENSGKLAEFKEIMLEIRKNDIEEKVAKGYMTQDKADILIQALKNHQDNCNSPETCYLDYCGNAINQTNVSRYNMGRGNGYGHGNRKSNSFCNAHSYSNCTVCQGCM